MPTSSHVPGARTGARAAVSNLDGTGEIWVDRTATVGDLVRQLGRYVADPESATLLGMTEDVGGFLVRFQAGGRTAP